ncbi:hypothetical protein TRFO_14252 [Tritrichomonas foetus]|uniref:Uncharacterized protein n=1 Tax=Tritrichomonas foetus TaxID=1144522 RepID=A0A1J4KZV0_9EUKA|nr:hypothetical protein TRFO_14252 [Tritrichomonas foetus]|eukprot:OHT15230.1 hypothetical protein TRFO_14252 [Tritrichomonas foetus]
MQINEQVTVVKAFPGVSSLCSFGCKSGRIGIFDIETNRFSYNYNIDKPIVAIDIDDENIMHTANDFHILRHDHRCKAGPTLQLQTTSEIVDIAVYETSIAAATKDGIMISDGRNIQRKITDNKINSIPPAKLHFLNKNSLVSGYEDSTVTIWDFFTEDMKTLDVPLMLKNRKMKPLSITSYTYKKVESIAVGYESGISFYNNREFVEHSHFNQRGHFGAFTSGPCFGTDYIVAVVDDSSVLPCALDKDEFSPLTIHGVNISSITANYLMLVAADDDEEGYIAVFMPEVFGDEFF